MPYGIVTRVNIEKGVGFIARPGSTDVKFSAQDCTPGTEVTDELRGKRVAYNDCGSYARDVRIQPS